MKNRYGIEYNFEKISSNVYEISGDLKHWRYGGKEGEQYVDYSDLGFVDPQGGPFIEPGYIIDERKVERIMRLENGNLLFIVEDDSNEYINEPSEYDEWRSYDPDC